MVASAPARTSDSMPCTSALIMRQLASEKPSMVSIGTGSPFSLPTSERPPKFCLPRRPSGGGVARIDVPQTVQGEIGAEELMGQALRLEHHQGTIGTQGLRDRHGVAADIGAGLDHGVARPHQLQEHLELELAILA